MAWVFILLVFPCWGLWILARRWDPGLNARMSRAGFWRWFIGLRVWQRVVLMAAAVTAYTVAYLTLGIVVWVVATVLLYSYASWVAWSAWKHRNAARPST